MEDLRIIPSPPTNRDPTRPRRGQLSCLPAFEADPIMTAAAITRAALEQDLAAAGCPSRTFVARSAGQQALVGSIGFHDADPSPVLAAAGEGDELAVWAPLRGCIPATAKTDPALAG